MPSDERTRSALFDSLAQKRVLRELQRTLPRDERIASGAADVNDCIKGGIAALGADTLLEVAAIFARHDQNGDGKISAREGLRMKTELRSVLAAGAPALLPDPGERLDFVDFCRRAAAQHATATAAAMGHDVAERAVGDEVAELIRRHGRDNGTVGLLEFRRIMQALGDRYGWDGSSVTALRRFHELDAQGTGELSAAQLEYLLSRLHVRQGRDPSPTAHAPRHSAMSSALGVATSSAANGGGAGGIRPPPGLSRAPTRSLLGGLAGDARADSMYRSASSGSAAAAGASVAARRPSAGAGRPSGAASNGGGGGQPPAPAPAGGEEEEETAETRYADNLLRNAETSMAQRDALEGLPFEEKRLIMGVFERFDGDCNCKAAALFLSFLFWRLRPSCLAAHLLTLLLFEPFFCVCGQMCSTSKGSSASGAPSSRRRRRSCGTRRLARAA